MYGANIAAAFDDNQPNDCPVCLTHVGNISNPCNCMVYNADATANFNKTVKVTDKIS